MSTLNLVRNAAFAAAWLVLAPESFAAGPNPFFAVDTALRDGQPRSATEQAVLLK
jgi:hypothetical protein